MANDLRGLGASSFIIDEIAPSRRDTMYREMYGYGIANTAGIARINMDATAPVGLEPPAHIRTDITALEDGSQRVTASAIVSSYDGVLHDSRRVAEQVSNEVSRRVERQLSQNIDELVNRIVEELREDIYVSLTAKIKDALK